MVNAVRITPARVRRLIATAMAARRSAYCPYSGFAVGAAVLAEDGRVFSGCNVENASYGLTVCAERSAVFAAVGAGARAILAVAVVTDSSPPAMPCGACRQVVCEFSGNGEQSGTVFFLASVDGLRVERRTMVDLLPEAFGPASFGSGIG